MKVEGNSMKKFVVGKLVDEENICNLSKERDAILRNINNGNNVVIYGPRNYGKTSLVKNVIMKQFSQTHKQAFIFFVDLFNVTDNESLTLRLKAALEHAMAEIPLKKWTNEIKKFVSHMRPEVSFDPVTGAASLSLKSIDIRNSQSMDDLFRVLKNISQKKDLLMVFDEFQDIVKLKSEQGIIRSFLQDIDSPVIVMGSKSHLLSEIFLKPREPFYQWGTPVSFSPIDYEIYHTYINERLAAKGIRLGFEVSKTLQDNMHRVPESINLVCAEIMENYENVEIEQEMVNHTITRIIETRQTQYEELLGYHSLKEQIIMASIAKRGQLRQFNSVEYLAELKMNNKTVATTFKILIDAGHIEKYNKVYRINDPLLETYLRLYR